MSDDRELFAWHRSVLLRGGPLDGIEVNIDALKLGHEIRLGYFLRVSEARSVLREVFYDVAGFRQDKYVDTLVADYGATQDTELPRIE